MPDMPFIIKQGKTNWKYLLVVVILAMIVGGGIWGYSRWVVKERIPLLEVQIPKKVIEPSPQDWDKILKRVDVNRDGKLDFIVAKKEWMGGLGPYFRIFAISWDGEKFVEIWKSPKTITTIGAFRVAVGDLDNNGKNEILVESSISFPEFGYYLFEYNLKGFKLEGMTAALYRVMDEKTKVIENLYLWYWRLSNITDYNEDGVKEILMETIIWVDLERGLPGRGPIIAIEWGEILLE